MTRVIKFRVWDRDEGVMGMSDDEESYYRFRVEDGIVVERCELVDKLLPTGHFQTTEWRPISHPVMQFTGQKDKNGSEIYEGDIVRFLDAYMYGEDGDWDECTCTGQIIWDDDLAQFYVTNRESMGNDDFWEQVDEAEVIGNIYENPELLNG